MKTKLLTFLFLMVLTISMSALACAAELKKDNATNTVELETFIDTKTSGAVPEWYQHAQSKWNSWGIEPITTEMRWERLQAIFDRTPEWEIHDGSEALNCEEVFHDLKNMDRKAIQILEPDLRPSSYFHPKIAELRAQCPFICIGEYRRGHQRGPIPSQEALPCDKKWATGMSLGNIELYSLSQYGLPDDTYALYSSLYAFETEKYGLRYGLSEGVEWVSGNLGTCEPFPQVQTGGLSLRYTNLNYETLSTSALIRYRSHPSKIFILKALTNRPFDDALADKKLTWSLITVKDIERYIPYGQKQGCLFSYRKFDHTYKSKGEKNGTHSE